jgi:hypothetical protein
MTKRRLLSPTAWNIVVRETLGLLFVQDQSSLLFSPLMVTSTFSAPAIPPILYTTTCNDHEVCRV